MLDLQAVAQKMRNLDIAMLTTIDHENGSLSARPMSNNKDVEYDGTSYFFTTTDTRMVKDLDQSAEVLLSFEGADSLYIAVKGTAELIFDKAEFEEHWQDNLSQWFQQGPNTPDLVMIKVTAERVKYWQGEKNEEWIA